MKRPVKFGKYYLLERINIGGMAEVFKAKSFGVEGFEKLLAIKRILPNIAEDEDFITMFIDEAKIAVQLNHANIAQIFDLGKIEDSFFIALEYVAGKDLRTIWERHKKHNLLLPIPMSCYVMIRMCEGLDYAHRKKDAGGRDLNIVHRDVSPQNILVSYEGEVKIIDFGIAKAANKASKTQAGILKGKFGYMSPEQVRGLPLDRRADIFSAGIILYEVLTGERLFVGESDFSTLEKVRNVEILPPSTYNRAIPDALEKIVLKALSKDPEDRFQSAYDMQEELQRFLIVNKTNFARKDLAAYMKRAFKADIEREMSRQAEYQAFNPGGMDDGLEPDTASVSSPMSPRPTSGLVAGRKKPTAPAIPASPPKPAAPAPPPVIQTGGDDDDDDVETVIFDTRSGLPEDQPTNPVEGQAAGGPPPLKSKPPPVPETSGSKGRRSATGKPETVSDIETTAPENLSAEAPGPPLGDEEPSKPSISDLEAFSTGEATISTGVQPSAQRRSRLNLIIALLAIVAVVVVGLAVFKYLQRKGVLGGRVTLTIQITPPDAQVLLDGNPAGQGSPLTLQEIPAGSHRLQATHEAYQPYEETLELKGAEARTVNITMNFIPAEIELTFEPPDAQVSLDGKAVSNKSPKVISDLLPGEHTFTFERSGYAPRSEKWTFKPRDKRKEKVVLTELFFDLEVQSDPAGARVFIDDEPKGATPFSLKKLPASRQFQLALRHPKFPDWTSTIRYDGEPVLKITKRLEAGVEAPPDKPEKPAPDKPAAPKDTPPKVDKPPKDKPIVKRPPRPPVTKPEPPKAGGVGYLRLNSNPWGNVWIDGKDIGQTTPLPKHELPAGKHKITIHFANGEKQDVEVEILPGEITTKIVKGKM